MKHYKPVFSHSHLSYAMCLHQGHQEDCPLFQEGKGGCELFTGRGCGECRHPDALQSVIEANDRANEGVVLEGIRGMCGCGGFLVKGCLTSVGVILAILAAFLVLGIVATLLFH